MTETNGKFWKNLIKVIHCDNLDELQKQLNEFYIGKFVINTEIHPILREGYLFVAFVNYKEKPD